MMFAPRMQGERADTDAINQTEKERLGFVRGRRKREMNKRVEGGQYESWRRIDKLQIDTLQISQDLGDHFSCIATPMNKNMSLMYLCNGRD